MGDPISPEDVPAGWYPDPDQAQTQRYWDGEDWTEQTAPLVERRTSWLGTNGGLTGSGNLAVGLVLAGLGTLLTIVGVFLPLADTESSLHIAGNSLIQHWEGAGVVCVALAGFLATLNPTWRPFAAFAGLGLIALAVVSGTQVDELLTYRNALSQEVAGNASPGAGIWTVGVGGALLFVSAFFAEWTAFTGGISEDAEERPPGSRMRRWEELMSGRGRVDED